MLISRKRRHPNPPAPLKSSRLPPARSRSLIPRPAPPFPRPVHRPAFPTPDDRLIRAINTLGETYNIPCPELLYLSTQRRERGLNQEEEARWRDLKREEEMRKASDRFLGRRRREEEEWEEWEAWETEGESRDVERDEESASRREMHRKLASSILSTPPESCTTAWLTGRQRSLAQDRRAIATRRLR